MFYHLIVEPQKNIIVAEKIDAKQRYENQLWG
jgi:hypothetical protein